MMLRHFSPVRRSMRWRRINNQSGVRGRSTQPAAEVISLDLRSPRSGSRMNPQRNGHDIRQQDTEVGQCWLTCTQPWHRSRWSWRTGSAHKRRVSAKVNATTAKSSWVCSSSHSPCTSSRSSATWICARSSNAKYRRKTKKMRHLRVQSRTMKPHRRCPGHRTATSQQ